MSDQSTSARHPKQELLRCSNCKNLKSRELFGPVIKRTGKPHSWCKVCQAVARRVAYRKNPEKGKDDVYRSRLKKVVELTKLVDTIKAATPCADCGLRFHPVCMDFDHCDPATKFECVSRMVNRALSWGKIQVEIAKCDVVCSNCHRIRTASLWMKRRSAKWNKLRDELAF